LQLTGCSKKLKPETWTLKPETKNMDTPNPNTTSRPTPPATQEPSDLSFNVMPRDGDPGRMSSPPPPSSTGGSGGSSYSYDNSSGSGHKWIYITVAIVVLLGLGAAAYYMLGVKKSSDEPQAATTKLPKVWLSQYFNTETCSDQSTCGDNADPDKDGSGNYEEFKASTNPINPDSDSDGLADGDEANIYKTDPTLKYTDRRETVAQNNWTDGVQIKNGFDPLTPALPFTEARKKQIADDTTKFKLHEPSITTLSASSSSSASPTPVPSTLESTAFVSKDKSYSLNAPKGWKKDDSGQFGTLVIFTSPKTEMEGKTAFNPNINIVAESVPNVKFDDYMKATKESLAKALTNYKLVEEKDVTISGVPAKILVGTFVQGTFHIKNIQLGVIKNGKAYIVTATTLESVWNQYASLFETSLMTFKLN
jgi:hypothetical protein